MLSWQCLVVHLLDVDVNPLRGEDGPDPQLFLMIFPSLLLGVKVIFPPSNGNLRQALANVRPLLYHSATFPALHTSDCFIRQKLQPTS